MTPLPMKLAVIGGGPSAFYVASRILSLLPYAEHSASQLRVHMFDRLWAPHGLVRYGVAPDHPEVKATSRKFVPMGDLSLTLLTFFNCTHKFDLAAADPRFRFFGNVNIGEDTSIPHTLPLSLSSVFNNYTHVIFATGCTLPTLHPALPLSPYCTPALSLVHWYTQHPSRPPPPPLDQLTHVSLIGNGNVSLDIARILLTNVSVLEKYDVPSPVLDVLSKSRVKHVSIIGRRGPLEAAFTTKELREMINLPEASMVPIEPALLLPQPDTSLTRQQSRVLQLLQKGSKNPFGSTPKSWSLDFYRSPAALTLPPAGSLCSSMAELTLAHTTLDPKHTHAIPTGVHTVLPTSLVVTSLGFHASPSLPFYDPALGHLRTTAGGRVVAPDTGRVLRNVYAAGWTATGAKGVLAATMMDAYAVADAVLSDWLSTEDDTGDIEEVHTTPVPDPTPQELSSISHAETVLNPSPSSPLNPPPEVVQGIRDGTVFQYGDWKRVDEEEVRRGEGSGKERERMSWEQAKSFLDHDQVG
ncbi:NADPH:adrenodoxin oxidoreductase, mitochondrial [Hypsizygus marmoreus]|uniref:NADPH:adrenodoxin oxidoreductase, mitochondrial n=1 Tax=Hypsizygus marmoreus TaxID=39966 RepID=A0A369JA95_HYPMA|nr:NADPH:adrenodoxin oxidoreductase, mitochondrial [Hypsizygus marmoreus]